MASTTETGSEQVFVFPKLVPRCRISLPFLLLPEYGNIQFTDKDGNALHFCEDVEYRSTRHRLLWLDYNRPGDEAAEIHFYSERYPPEGQPRPLPGECAPEDLLFFADYFRSDADATLDGLLDRWRVSIGSGYIKRRGGSRVSIVPCPVEFPHGRIRAPAPGCGAPPSALRLDASDLEQQILARRTMSLGHPGLQRVHLRGWFHDDMRGASHWIGISSKSVGVAVGTRRETPACYCYLSEFDVDIPGQGRWMQTEVKRARGWHVLALEFFEDTSMIFVDKKCVCKMPCSALGELETIWLGAPGTIECDGSTAPGHWGGVELLHIPLNRGLWESDPSAPPDHAETLWMAPDDMEDLSATREVEIEEPPAMPDEPTTEVVDIGHYPEAPKIKGKSSRRGARARRRDPSPVRTAAGLQIECWSLPDETSLQKLDRVVDVFLGKLKEAGMKLPDNITRLEDCPEPGHTSCHVYSFGTRRLHISTREGEGGRLTLVVRCGGGFLDFVDFAARHGRVEDLKLRRLADSKGSERIQLTSVLSHGAVRLTDCSKMNTTEPTEKQTPTARGAVAEAGTREQMLTAVFRELDLDGNGSIDRGELAEVLKRLPDDWTDEAIDKVLAAADADRDGRIQLQEFLEWVFANGDDQRALLAGVESLGLVARDTASSRESEHQSAERRSALERQAAASSKRKASPSPK